MRVPNLSPVRDSSLPFKGRDGEGMGFASPNHPIPLLTSPLKGEEIDSGGLVPIRNIAVGLLLLIFILISGISGASAQEESVCIKCHGAQTGRLAAPVGEWRNSVHAASGISCHGCHGGDPSDMAMAMSPERGFLGVPRDEAIPGFCGRCHVGVKDDYLASAHGRALGRGGPHCVTCHGSHAVRTATPELINSRDCSRCHEYGRAEEIKSAVIDTDQRITGIEQSLAALHRIGITTREMEGELFALRNDFHRLFHSVEVEKVRSRTAGFQADLAKIRGRIAAIEAELNRRKLWGGAVVALLVAGGILAWLLHRSYIDDKKAG
ncbi:MAG: cytochrome c3 family protein [Geobacteraceae bacterium]|nr:cytochrome c3 family protein [Geobacteraceae bacterium]